MTDRNNKTNSNEAGNTLLFLAVVVAFALLSFGAYTLLKKDTAKEIEVPVVAEKPVVPIETRDLEITMPLENATSTFPLKITGNIYGNGWNAFEGQAGTVSLLDESGKVIVESTPLKIEGEWMKLPVGFSITLGDAKLTKSLAGKKVTLRFVAENPSGEGETKTKNVVFTVSQ